VPSGGAENNPGARKRVLVVYHYFAHYREAVLRDMLEHGEHEYHFAGDTVDDGKGIRLTEAIPADRFIRARCRYLGPLMLQPRAIALAFSPRFDALILLGNAMWPTTWLAAIVGRLTGKRVLFWTHGWQRREAGVKGLIRNTFYRLAHALLLYGHNAKIVGISHAFDPARLHVIYNSLDYDRQVRVRESLTDEGIAARRAACYGDDGIPGVMAITRLQPAKKLGMLIDAAAICRDRGTPLTLLFVGDGPQRAELEAMASDKGVRAHFFGACYDEQAISEMFGASDLCCIPGPAGLTVMHSLANGTPFVTNDDTGTQMPEFEAVVPGENGALFAEGSTEDLAEKLLACVNDRRMREEGRACSIAMIERFFNPVTQRVLIDRAVDGQPADDLFAAHNGPLYRTAPRG
jgi:glycosyltransferase involved in cell wall biosynthesis